MSDQLADLIGMTHGDNAPTFDRDGFRNGIVRVHGDELALQENKIRFSVMEPWIVLRGPARLRPQHKEHCWCKKLSRDS